jgi:hypothetical protein
MTMTLQRPERAQPKAVARRERERTRAIVSSLAIKTRLAATPRCCSDVSHTSRDLASAVVSDTSLLTRAVSIDETAAGLPETTARPLWLMNSITENRSGSPSFAACVIPFVIDLDHFLSFSRCLVLVRQHERRRVSSIIGYSRIRKTRNTHRG